jgi:hypothetical protein
VWPRLEEVCVRGLSRNLGGGRADSGREDPIPVLDGKENDDDKRWMNCTTRGVMERPGTAAPGDQPPMTSNENRRNEP